MMDALFQALDITGVIADLMTVIVFGVSVILIFIGFSLIIKILHRITGTGSYDPNDPDNYDREER